MITLYHRWSSMAAQQVRLALSYKAISFSAQPLPQADDAIWFDLGLARADMALLLPEQPIQTDALSILPQLDDHAGGAPIYNSLIDDAAWQALSGWRAANKNVLERLYAPVLPAFSDIGANESDLASYKTKIAHDYGMSVEALSNDRYDGFNQFAAQAQLPQLALYLAKNNFI